MFNLNDEVLAWCQSVFPSGVERQARIDELADHLHCEIDRWLGEGLSEQQAFEKAKERLGSKEDLAVENAKNRTSFNRLIDALRALCRGDEVALRQALDPKMAAFWILGISLVFAGLIILTSHLTRDSGNSQTWTYIWIAVWWVPYSFLSVAAGKVSETKACQEKDKVET